MQGSRRSLPKYLAIIGLEIVWLFAVPVALTSGYLWLSRSQRWWTGTTDYVALGLSILIGAAGIWVLPISGIRRLLLFLPYAVVMWNFLDFWSLGFVCASFRACL